MRSDFLYLIETVAYCAVLCYRFVQLVYQGTKKTARLRGSICSCLGRIPPSNCFMPLLRRWVSSQTIMLQFCMHVNQCWYVLLLFSGMCKRTNDQCPSESVWKRFAGSHRHWWGPLRQSGKPVYKLYSATRMCDFNNLVKSIFVSVYESYIFALMLTNIMALSI